MIIADLFLILVVYITYRFFLPLAQTKPAVRRFIPAFVVFGLLFILVAIFSLSEWITALSPRNLSPISTVAELSQIPPPAPDDRPIRILLIGEPPTASRPNITQFIMKDGVVDIALDKNFVLINTDQPSQTAVLLGAITHSGVVAQVIYEGDVAGYFIFLDRFAIIPILTIIISALGALITWWIPIRRLNSIHRKIE
ncbi:MAG: hypothetical protein CUN52_04590 [Phototrophicales bacterium]|nr:MAG: hypothetical protein CUN52_04590 [Phototrophicales bacterium]